MTQQLSDCCKAGIKLTGKERPNHFACEKCGRIIGTPIIDPEWKKLSDENKHIPTAEIEHDIIETEQEIATMTAEAEHLEKTPLSLPSAKWDHMRAQSRRGGIVQRKEFLEKLKGILAVRKEEGI